MDLFYNFFGAFTLIEFVLKILLSVVIYIVFYFLSAFLYKESGRIVKKLLKIQKDGFESAYQGSFAKPLSNFVKIAGAFFAITNLPFNNTFYVTVYSFMSLVLRISGILLISVALQNFVVNLPEFIENLEDKLGGVNKTLITFFTKLAKALIMVFTAVIIIEEFGYDVTSLITGLGLGGLTFALAAQDIASNFMSGIVILTDKPFGVGDWITVGGLEGIVEEMNFRSVRIRTFDNALITVPNSKVSGDSVTNWTKMQMRKTNIVIGLLYSTTKETLQAVCDDIKAALTEMEEIKADSILVVFDNFNASSLDVKISYNSYPVAGPDHLALKQKVQYKIMDIVAKYDTDFAYNTFTVINEK
ncbi:MAG: mechanosensitive ion channel family protein [Oscillospiraceae bacterium]|nr:mechanosensitive ion channel family protein [Oscillospiraceae bacterium]